ncbi:MAG: NifU family protein [Acidobacteria bacterium]|nr:MAG: NifU family protein [Acidobacteriota bacterium]
MSSSTEGSIIEIASPALRAAVTDVEVDIAELESALDYIRPALQADGGDVLLDSVNGGTVNLKLLGACGGCPISETTVTAGIERILKDRVPGVVEVLAT